MNEYHKKQRSFLDDSILVALILLFMGVIFLTIAIVIQMMPIDPNNLTVRINGVRQPTSEQSVTTFRLISLLTFGLIGAIETTIGCMILKRKRKQRKQAVLLKDAGTYLIADFIELEPSNIRVNNRRLMYLRCAYTDSTGRTYIFRSGLLRKNPIPYLQDGKVTVYYDRYDMSTYFVDIDGSIALGSNVIEL